MRISNFRNPFKPRQLGQKGVWHVGRLGRFQLSIGHHLAFYGNGLSTYSAGGSQGAVAILGCWDLSLKWTPNPPRSQLTCSWRNFHLIVSLAWTDWRLFAGPPFFLRVHRGFWVGGLRFSW